MTARFVSGFDDVFAVAERIFESDYKNQFQSASRYNKACLKEALGKGTQMCRREAVEWVGLLVAVDVPYGGRDIFPARL